MCNFQRTLKDLINLNLNGGDKEIRTLDPLRARQVLSQLSYTPMSILKEDPSKLNRY